LSPPPRRLARPPASMTPAMLPVMARVLSVPWQALDLLPGESPLALQKQNIQCAAHAGQCGADHDEDQREGAAVMGEKGPAQDREQRAEADLHRRAETRRGTGKAPAHIDHAGHGARQRKAVAEAREYDRDKDGKRFM